MPVIAEDIVENARGFSPLFTRQAITDKTALEEITRLEQELADQVTEESGEALAEWVEIAWPVDALTAGIPLPEHMLILDARVYFTGLVPAESLPITIVSGRQSLSLPHTFPSAYVQGGVLRLTDQRFWYGDYHGWEDAVRLDVLIVPVVVPITTLPQLITLPDTARAFLERGLALFMANRTGASLPTLRQQYDQARDAFYRGIISRGSTRSWQVEVVE